MAVKCEACSSTDTEAELNTWFCFNCGHRTPMSNVPPPSAGLEATTTAE